MTYIYTQYNLLDKPNTYMYTPFQGYALLESYLSNRISIIKQLKEWPYETDKFDEYLVCRAYLVLEEQINNLTPHAVGLLHSYLDTIPPDIARNKDCEEVISKLTKSLELMTVMNHVNTLELIRSLIAVQLAENYQTQAQEWLDRLVQRFEVTKKIYEVYQPGFRKGDGEYKNIILYWLFALALCLQYSKTQRLKYLNVLLKVCDLLCSAPKGLIGKEVPVNGLALVLATEAVSVCLLAQKRGVSIVYE